VVCLLVSPLLLRGYDDALVEFANKLTQHNEIFLGKNLRNPLPIDYKLDTRLEAKTCIEIAVVGAHLVGMPLHNQLLEAHLSICS
jgi:allophanate hydrolase